MVGIRGPSLDEETPRELKSIGIDITLAPVVDVATNFDNPGITIRSFGSDPEKVALLGANFIQGTQSTGIGTVAKHFPGKGAATEDAHFDLPIIDLSWGETVRTYLHPFRECIKNGVQGVMTTHVIYPNFPGAEEVPATFDSKLIKGYLRGEMNFTGVVFSDDLEMGAISRYFPFKEAVVKTIRAGHDMLSICSDYEKQQFAFQTLLKVGQVDSNILEEMDEALDRIERLRNFSQRSEYPEELIPENDAAELAAEIAESSITVMRGWVPISVALAKINKISAIIPDLSQLESVEEGFEVGEDNFIERALKERFPVPLYTEFIPLDPSKGEIEKAWENASRADLVLAFIFNARFLKGQRLLLEKLKTHPQKTIFILIRNPFDLEFLGPEMTTVITYGYRKIQIAAAIKVLGGDIPALGKLPFRDMRR